MACKLWLNCKDHPKFHTVFQKRTRIKNGPGFTHHALEHVELHSNKSRRWKIMRLAIKELTDAFSSGSDSNIPSSFARCSPCITAMHNFRALRTDEPRRHVALPCSHCPAPPEAVFDHHLECCTLCKTVTVHDCRSTV